MSEPDLSEFEDLTRAEDLRKALYHTQQKLRKAHARTEDLVAAVHEGAMEAMLSVGPVPPAPAPSVDRRRVSKPEVALWHLTDWQGSKVTASYNSEIMRERVLRFCDKATKLTDVQRADHPIRKCLIMFGGDLIEGLFNFPQQPWEVDAGLFDQYVRAGRLKADVVRRALAIYEEVEIVDEWGNHGRLGSKRAAVPRSDNLDRMVSHLAREQLAGEERLTWGPPSAEDIQRIEIGNYRALLIHGDEVGRNGYASPMTIVNHVAKWQSGSYAWEFRDCYLGHYHNHCEWSLPNGLGAVYQTGSPESDNRYAGIHMAASAIPSQRLHFIDPRRGRVTAQYKVHLDDEPK
jgi:hypothetical protein